MSGRPGVLSPLLFGFSGVWFVVYALPGTDGSQKSQVGVLAEHVDLRCFVLQGLSRQAVG